VFGYFAVYQPLQAYIRHHQIVSFQSFFAKEFYADHNIALSIFLGAKILASAIIISHAMVFTITGVIVFSFLGYILQELVIKLFEYGMGTKSFVSEIVEQQNMPIAIMYACVCLSVALLIGGVMA
jgi:hypothetical protein